MAVPRQSTAVAAAKNHNVEPGGVDEVSILKLGVLKALLGRREKVHGVVNSLEVVSRNVRASRPRGSRSKHDGVVVLGELAHGRVALLADVHVRLESDALFRHEIDTTL